MPRGYSCLFVESLEFRRLLANPAFLVPAFYAAGASPFSPVMADFNADGKPDIAVANSDDNSVSVLMNHGDGTFADKVDYLTPQSPSSIAAGDFNGDGKTDLAVAFSDGTSGTIRVLLNSGNGTLLVGNDNPAATTAPLSLAAADFDGNGKTDLVVVNYAQNGTANVMLSNGDGTFVRPVQYDTRANPVQVLAADFSGDGKPDFAVMSPSDSSVRIFLNQGDGSFVATADYLTGLDPRYIAAADFDRNGTIDLAVAHDGSAIILPNDGGGAFASGTSYRMNPSPHALYTSIVAADVNGDGYVDLVSHSDLGSFENALAVALNDGHGGLGAPIEYPFGSALSTMTAADVNGDGKVDLVGASNEGVAVVLNGGPSIFAQPTNYPGGTRPTSVFASDFNSDGKMDLFVSGGGLFLNHGDGSFAEQLPAFPGAVGLPLAAADFNRDGKPDLVIDRTSDLGVQLNNGDGTFGTYTQYVNGAGPFRPAFKVLVADFNGDGAPDLAVSPVGGSSLTVLLNNGDGSLAPAGEYPFNGSLVAADLNGDGRLDLAVSGASQLQILINGGGETFSAGNAYAAGPGALATADLDGDGNADLVVSGEDALWTLLNSGDGTFALARYAVAGGAVAAADFNRDGKPDLALTDLPGQNLKILLNSGHGGLASPLGYATGGYPLSVIAADFNGDSKPDLAWVNMMSNNLSVMLNLAPPFIRSVPLDRAVKELSRIRSIANEIFAGGDSAVARSGG